MTSHKEQEYRMLETMSRSCFDIVGQDPNDGLFREMAQPRILQVLKFEAEHVRVTGAYADSDVRPHVAVLTTSPTPTTLA
jgi:hypothetical protein